MITEQDLQNVKAKLMVSGLYTKEFVEFLDLQTRLLLEMRDSLHAIYNRVAEIKEKVLND